MVAPLAQTNSSGAAASSSDPAASAAQADVQVSLNAIRDHLLAHGAEIDTNDDQKVSIVEYQTWVGGKKEQANVDVSAGFNELALGRGGADNGGAYININSPTYDELAGDLQASNLVGMDKDINGIVSYGEYKLWRRSQNTGALQIVDSPATRNIFSKYIKNLENSSLGVDMQGDNLVKMDADGSGRITFNEYIVWKGENSAGSKFNVSATAAEAFSEFANKGAMQDGSGTFGFKYVNTGETSPESLVGDFKLAENLKASWPALEELQAAADGGGGVGLGALNQVAQMKLDPTDGTYKFLASRCLKPEAVQKLVNDLLQANDKKDGKPKQGALIPFLSGKHPTTTLEELAAYEDLNGFNGFGNNSDPVSYYKRASYAKLFDGGEHPVHILKPFMKDGVEVAISRHDLELWAGVDLQDTAAVNSLLSNPRFADFTNAGTAKEQAAKIKAQAAVILNRTDQISESLTPFDGGAESDWVNALQGLGSVSWFAGLSDDEKLLEVASKIKSLSDLNIRKLISIIEHNADQNADRDNALYGERGLNELAILNPGAQILENEEGSGFYTVDGTYIDTAKFLVHPDVMTFLKAHAKELGVMAPDNPDHLLFSEDTHKVVSQI